MRAQIVISKLSSRQNEALRPCNTFPLIATSASTAMASQVQAVVGDKTSGCQGSAHIVVAGHAPCCLLSSERRVGTVVAGLRTVAGLQAQLAGGLLSGSGVPWRTSNRSSTSGVPLQRPQLLERRTALGHNATWDAMLACWWGAAHCAARSGVHIGTSEPLPPENPLATRPVALAHAQHANAMTNAPHPSHV